MHVRRRPSTTGSYVPAGEDITTDARQSKRTRVVIIEDLQAGWGATHQDEVPEQAGGMGGGEGATFGEKRTGPHCEGSASTDRTNTAFRRAAQSRCAGRAYSGETGGAEFDCVPVLQRSRLAVEQFGGNEQSQPENAMHLIYSDPNSACVASLATNALGSLGCETGAHQSCSCNHSQPG